MIIILLLSVFSRFQTGADALVLNKCCGNGTRLGVRMRCEPSKDFLIDDNYEWFPKSALFTPGHERLTEDEQNNVMKWIVKNVQYGSYNFSCKKPEFSVFGEENEFFRILVEDTDKVDVVISVPDDEDEIKFDEDDASKWKLPLEEVCIDTLRGMHVIIYCPGHSTPWIRKCCPPKMFFNVTSRACAKYPVNLTLTDWKPHNASGLLQKYFLVVPKAYRAPCSRITVLRAKERIDRCRGFQLQDTKFHFHTNGSVQVLNTILNTEQYCGDKTWHAGGELIHQNLIYCKESRKIGSLKATYGGLFLFGGICLLATVIISLLFPELRQRIHNKIAITHNATLMVAHLIWGAILLLPVQVSITLCCVLCISLQFSFLGALFWMNAMCINMSSTFRTTQTISIQGGKSEMRRYCIYSAYAWGLTFLVSAFTVLMEFIEKPPMGLPRPGFSCFCDFDRNSFSVFVYFYGPMVVLLIFNLVLYIFTTLKIMSVVRESKKILQQSDSSTTGGTLQSDKQMLILYTKLFLLMGITWLTEIIGWAVGATNDNAFIIILDTINLLRAVFIFILFVCKPLILRKIRDYLRQATGRLRRSGSSHSTTDATSVSVGPSRKVSQQEEISRKKSMDEWISMKPMDKSKDKAVRIVDNLIHEEDETEQSHFLNSQNENISILKT